MIANILFSLPLQLFPKTVGILGYTFARCNAVYILSYLYTKWNEDKEEAIDG